MDAMDTYDRAAVEALLTTVCCPLQLEESSYDAGGRLLYQGPPGGCAAVVGVESTHTRFGIYDRHGARVAEILVCHALGDDYDPHEVLADARALTLLFARAPEYLTGLPGRGGLDRCRRDERAGGAAVTYGAPPFVPSDVLPQMSAPAGATFDVDWLNGDRGHAGALVLGERSAARKPPPRRD